MNLLSPPLKQKLIKSPITDLSFGCGISVYRIKNTNLETEITLFLEFILAIAWMTA